VGTIQPTEGSPEDARRGDSEEQSSAVGSVKSQDMALSGRTGKRSGSDCALGPTAGSAT
jgi:hypothetical protein